MLIIKIFNFQVLFLDDLKSFKVCEFNNDKLDGKPDVKRKKIY